MSMFSRPHLDTRLIGSDVFVATPGTSEHYITFDYDCKFNGIQAYSECSELGDHITVETQYYAGPTYGWKRYKKFGKQFNLFPNDKHEIILFPTEPKAGVRIRIVYNNASATDVKFALNLFTFVDHVKIQPQILQEGEDW